jgi:poly(3-hydroxybutyrate) depolymerase
VRGRTFAPVAVTLMSASLLLGSEAMAQEKIHASLLGAPSGRFEFRVDAAPRPLAIWYCRPQAVGPDTRIVFLMHGGNPQTVRQACDLGGEFARAHNALLLAPEFSTEAYPGDAYMFGGMVDTEGGGLLPRARWGLMVIEQLFDAARKGLGIQSGTYDLAGFSGGGQFVQRLVLFLPEARFRRAVAGSPGRYAFPTRSIPFPYGLGEASVPASQLQAAFARDFILILGDRDTDDRDREPAAVAQGKNRLARGLRFFATATEEAAALKAPLGWRLEILPGVDHDPKRVVRAALDHLIH